MKHKDKGAVSIAGTAGSRARAATECARLETGVLAAGDAAKGALTNR
jgi:hypothetical protein